jgi:hypothetical protein
MKKVFESIMRGLKDVKLKQEIEAYRNNKYVKLMNNIIDGDETPMMKGIAQDLLTELLPKWYPNLFSA